MINLLPRDLQEKRETQKFGKTATTISVVVLSLTFLIVGGLFAYRLIKLRELGELNLSYNNVKGQIEQQRPIEGTLKSIHQKLDQVKGFFTGRYEYGDIVQELTNLSGQRIQFTGIEVDGQTKYSLGGRTDDLAELASFMKKLDQDLPNYQNVWLSQLNFNDSEFNYLFRLTFEYQQKLENENNVSMK